MCSFEEFVDGLSSAGAVIYGPLIDVHSDEFIGELFVETAAEIESVFDSFDAVFERVEDAGFEDFADAGHGVGSEVAADDVAAEG